MLRLCSLIIIIFVCAATQAQQSITEFIKLDTVFSTGIKIDNVDVTVKNVKIKIVNEEAWIYYPNWKDNDSIHFLRINLNTYKKELINIYVPSISFKISSPTIDNFDIDKNALVLLYTSNNFAYFKNTKQGYVFDFIEPLQCAYTGIRLLSDKKVVIYNNYNSHPKSNPDKTILYVYDCNEHKVVYTSRPHFNAIEFCHFNPNEWLDVCSENIIFSQTTSYSISFFDFKLNLAKRFTHSDKDWVYADTNRIKALEAVKPAISPKDFIERLSPMEDTVSRIEAVYSLSPHKLLIRKIPANAKKQNRLRTYDILALDAKTKEWTIVQKNIKDLVPEATALCTKKDFPVNSVYHTITFSEHYYIKLVPRFTPVLFDRTYKQNKENEEKAMSTLIPELYIHIFKADFK